MREQSKKKKERKKKEEKRLLKALMNRFHRIAATVSSSFSAFC